VGSEARARLGLAALLGATLLTFGAVFDNSNYMGPTLLGMLLAIGLTLLCRRLGAGALITVAASTIALGWYLMVVFEGHQTFYGLPAAAAAKGLWRAVLRAVQASDLDFAPVPVRPGYVIMSVVAMWLVATVSELATFRWRRPLLAALPSIGLFSFLVVVGNESVVGFLVLVFLSALLTYWGLEASHRLRSWGRWVGAWGQRDDAGESVTGRVARRMGYSCVAAALVAPLLLPALGSGVLSWRNPTGVGDGSGTGGAGSNAVNPFVQLHPQLLNQEENELFRVTAGRRAYWRLLSLSDFDGESWTEAAAPETIVQGGLIENPDPTPFEDVLTQRFDLTHLEGPYLPAAGRPSFVSFEDGARPIKYNADTHHLEVSEGDVARLRYTVTSKLPDITFAKLNRAAVGEQLPPYTELPDDLSPQVRALAGQWTKGAKSDFAKLVALQSHFQSDFSYSENVDTKDSGDYLTYFLTESRAGYCQQFSTAFALLARTLGYPSRVSVGFLPGDPAPGDDSTFIVKGTHAHAWPEVYFEDFGWVRFEPTPRAQAQLPSYTIGPSPANGEGPGAAGATVNPNEQRLGTKIGLDVTAANVDPRVGQGVEAGARPRRSDYAWQRTFGRLVRGLALALLLFVLLVPLLKELKTRYRYARATSPSSTAEAAFAQFLDEAGELAGPRRASESAVAYALRLVAGGRVGPGPALRLATLYELAEYSASGVSQGQAGEARRLATRLRSALWKRASWWKRATLLFSPARLRPAPRPRPGRS
jgi:transglutaminase-like putative cysteine protease